MYGIKLSSLPNTNKRNINYNPEELSLDPHAGLNPSVVGKRSPEEIQIILDRFETNKQEYIDEILKQIQIIAQRQPNYYYFIGRLNPPHEGHIQALLSVIQKAITNGGMAIILLGSGPNNGERTPKDPLDFGLKREFVIYKLKEELIKINPQLNVDVLFGPSGQVKILEMGKPVSQIASVIQDDMKNLLDLLDKIYTFRISGEKDGGEDLEKLNWIEKGLVKAGIKDKNGDIIQITTEVIPQPAVITTEDETMSATHIRNIIYDMDFEIPQEERMEKFRKETADFYGDYTPRIFDAINRFHPNNPNNPIKVVIVKPKKSKTVKQDAKAGGSRSKRRKTKRRKTRKTKRRKSKRRRLTKRRN